MAGPTPNTLSVSKIKSNLLNLAQTSVYLVRVQPTQDTISFLSSEGRDVNYYSSGENIELLCSETNLPGSSLATHEVTNDYPGVTEKFAYRRIYDETIDFTFYVDKNYGVIEYFDGWMNYVTGQGTTFGNDEYIDRTRHYRMNYPSLYKTDSLYITKFEKDIGNSMTYQFIGAFPINIVSMPLSYDASNILKCTVSFSYMRYVRKRSILTNQDIERAVNAGVESAYKTYAEILAQQKSEAARQNSQVQQQSTTNNRPRTRNEVITGGFIR